MIDKDILCYNSDQVQEITPDLHADMGCFLRFEAGLVRTGRFDGMKIITLKHWLALARTDLYWIEPRHGTNEESIPAQTQMLLWEREDGRFGICLPLIAGDLRSYLQGGEKGFSLFFEGALPEDEPTASVLAFVGLGENPYQLIQQAMETVAGKLRSFRLRRDKAKPAFMDYLGWCTWDAFYHEVDEEKVCAGLESFRKGGISPGFMILDDGAIDVIEDFLNNIDIQHQKFPSGLEGLIQKVKKTYGIEMFGLWHAFEGYWAGLNPASRLAEEYRLVHNRGVIRPWIGNEQDLYLIDPRDIYRFFHDFYRFLYQCGVDMLKVDGQSALNLFTDGKLGRVSTMRAYQEAMQGAAALHFGPNLIHCMCNGSDVAYHLIYTSGWRNSQDYFPKQPMDTQQKHVYINGMNNLWTAIFAWPDWDMFQTHSMGAEFHAAARSISGGPVYVCDKPGQQDFSLLKKMTLSGGQTPRWDRPALPARDCLFVDCLHEAKLLKITNRRGKTGVLGLFHCQTGGAEITGSFCPMDVEDLEGELFAAYFFRTGKLEILKRTDRGEVTLSPMEYELVTLTPVEDGVAVLGLVEKFAGGAVVEEAGFSEPDEYVFRLRDGGRVALYCKTEPKEIYVAGRKIDGEYTLENGLLFMELSTGKMLEVKVRL